eukprot:2960199-Alexandrium_andersonii.AAC.2
MSAPEAAVALRRPRARWRTRLPSPSPRAETVACSEFPAMVQGCFSAQPQAQLHARWGSSARLASSARPQARARLPSRPQ